MDPLIKAWIWLIALSAATTVIASQPELPAGYIVFPILILSGWKARVILNGYLGLGPSRFWRRSFNGIVMVFLLLALGVYLIPGLL